MRDNPSTCNHSAPWSLPNDSQNLINYSASGLDPGPYICLNCTNRGTSCMAVISSRLGGKNWRSGQGKGMRWQSWIPSDTRDTQKWKTNENNGTEPWNHKSCKGATWSKKFSTKMMHPISCNHFKSVRKDRRWWSSNLYKVKISLITRWDDGSCISQSHMLFKWSFPTAQGLLQIASKEILPGSSKLTDLRLNAKRNTTTL